MVDNTTLNTGSGGDVMASDDIAGVKFQRIKLIHGGDGTNAGDVSTTNPFPVVAVIDTGATFRGRAQTFRIPGLAGTTGQKLFTLHNATGSTKIVRVNRITVDTVTTVVKAVTVLPPIIRIHRVTVLPTAGTACPKVAKDTTLTSNASVTCLQGASADGTGTAITATIPASSILSQEFAPRLITAAGYEMFDRAEMLVDEEIVLRALEGIVVELVYTAATQNPITDMWIVGCDWYEV